MPYDVRHAIYNKVPKIDESVCQCQYSTVSVCWCASGVIEQNRENKTKQNKINI